jgi:hypothetical protein
MINIQIPDMNKIHSANQALATYTFNQRYRQTAFQKPILCSQEGSKYVTMSTHMD